MLEDSLVDVPLDDVIRRWLRANDGHDVTPRHVDHVRFAQVVLTMLDEREYQSAKYGTIDERQVPLPGYLVIMRAELAEADEGYIRGHDDTMARDEVRQVGAVAFACLEQLGVVPRTWP